LAEAAEFLVEISAWPAVVIEPAPADNLGGSVDLWAFRPIRGVIARYRDDLASTATFTNWLARSEGNPTLDLQKLASFCQN
jgi:hypothetical protein